MIREISAMEARKNFGELLNEVRYLHDNIIIKKAGKPIAVLIDMALFERVTKFRTQLESLTPEHEKSSLEENIPTIDTETPEELEEAEKQ
jgi:prevent-host-death family protein